MMIIIAAAAVAAAQPATVPADAHAQHAQMQMGQSGERMKDCCKDCCKDMAKHDGQAGEHSEHSSH